MVGLGERGLTNLGVRPVGLISTPQIRANGCTT